MIWKLQITEAGVRLMATPHTRHDQLAALVSKILNARLIYALIFIQKSFITSLIVGASAINQIQSREQDFKFTVNETLQNELKLNRLYIRKVK